MLGPSKRHPEFFFCHRAREFPELPSGPEVQASHPKCFFAAADLLWLVSVLCHVGFMRPKGDFSGGSHLVWCVCVYGLLGCMSFASFTQAHVQRVYKAPLARVICWIGQNLNLRRGPSSKPRLRLFCEQREAQPGWRRSTPHIGTFVTLGRGTSIETWTRAQTQPAHTSHVSWQKGVCGFMVLEKPGGVL